MAGLWNIVVGSAGENIRRLNVLLLRTELTGVAMGIRLRAAAKQNLETELGRVLTTDEANDLISIANIFDAGTIQDKLVYAAKMEFAFNAAELNLIEETEFRTVLGI